MEKKSLCETMLKDFYFLINTEHYLSASAIGWNYILKNILNICFDNNIIFDSTETALAGFFQISGDKNLNIKIHQVYLLITILNFDNDDSFLENELVELSDSISFIVQKLLFKS